MTRCVKLLLLPLRVLASVAFLPIVFFTSRLGLFTGLALLPILAGGLVLFVLPLV